MNDEFIVLLNERREPIGSAPKLASHHAHTPFHLAFSSYVFNEDGQLLVTKRAESKKVWPGVWTNTCCGHPAPNESMQDAITRRLHYELGMKADKLQEIVPDYSYRTPPFNGIIENEFCPIYFVVSSDQPRPNPEEVADFKWIDWHEYVRELEADTENIWSWWCKDQLRVILPRSTSDIVTAYTLV